MAIRVVHIVAALCAALLGWAWLAQLDIVATAPGQLVPRQHLKIVQPADAGTLREIRAQPGQRVEAGDILLVMDATMSQADDLALSRELAFRQLQRRRIDTALQNAPWILAPDDDAELFAQVSQQHEARSAVLRDALAQERATLERDRQAWRAAQATLQKLQSGMPVFERSWAAFEQLGRDGFHSALAVQERRQELVDRTQEVRAQHATTASLAAAVVVAERRLARLYSEHRQTLEAHKAELIPQIERLQAERLKSVHRLERLVLRAPARGVVKDVATHTVGAVVAPGTVVLTLVPQDDPLVAEVMVRNEDVGFVHEGQAVRLKLAAYPFQKHGTVEGRVAHLGPDAQTGGVGATSGEGKAPDPPGYRALVTLAQPFVTSGGGHLPLTAGMQVVAEMRLGQRSVIEYLMAPIRQVTDEAGRER